MDTPVETITLAYFCTGATALAKKLAIKLGVREENQHNWLIAVCVLAGAIYTYLTTYQPELWRSISSLMLAATTSGNVALLKELLSKRKPSGA